MDKQCIAPQEIQEGDLLAYVEGDASPTVVRHIAKCSACAQEVESLREVDLLFSAAFQYAPSSLVAEGPLTHGNVAVPPQARPKPSKKRWSWPRLTLPQPVWGMAALAFAAVLVLLGAVYGFARISLTTTAEQAGDFVAATLEIMQDAADTQVSGTSNKPSKVPVLISGIAENPAAIAPPRDLLLMLEDEWTGLIEDSSAIAPPRDILVMLEGEIDRQLDYDFVRSSARGEARWDKTVVTNQKDGVAHFLWIDNVDGLSTVYVARSDDNGQTLTEGVPVSRGVDKAFNPILAVDSSGNLYAVWRTRHHIDIDIFFARSDDGGQTWSNVVRINDDIRQAFNPSLAVDTQGRVYVAWQNHPGTVATDIFLSQSSDGGRTWSKERRMAN
jgi:hypothetical protein